MIRIDVALRRGAFALGTRFEAPAAGVVALFGRSGCGKTTLVNIIGGLLRPDRGRIAIGEDILLDTAAGRCVPAEERGIGYVFQDARLFPHLTVAANMRYGLARARGRNQAIGFDELRGRSRAASASASHSRGRSSRSRACCCSTSRSPRSMPHGARKCCPTSRRCGCGCAFP